MCYYHYLFLLGDKTEKQRLFTMNSGGPDSILYQTNPLAGPR